MDAGLIFYVLIFFPSIILSTNAGVDALTPQTSSDNAKVTYLVYLYDRPPTLSPEIYYTLLLSSVVGSEKAAKESLIYAYREIDGFAAKLTVEQAALLEKQDGVANVEKDRYYHLLAPGGLGLNV